MSSESDEPNISDDEPGMSAPPESVVVPYTELAPDLLHRESRLHKQQK